MYQLFDDKSFMYVYKVQVQKSTNVQFFYKKKVLVDSRPVDGSALFQHIYNSKSVVIVFNKYIFIYNNNNIYFLIFQIRQRQ